MHHGFFPGAEPTAAGPQSVRALSTRRASSGQTDGADPIPGFLLEKKQIQV